MKTLEQIQEENREAIIMANNPEAKTYEEALEMELGTGCKIHLGGDRASTIMSNPDNIKRGTRGWGNENSKFHQYIKLTYPEGEDYITKIIGKPLTLDRVLIALSGVACDLTLSYDNLVGDRIVNIRLDNPFSLEGNFKWDLTKKTLEEQSEKIQKVIKKLLIK